MEAWLQLKKHTPSQRKLTLVYLIRNWSPTYRTRTRTRTGKTKLSALNSGTVTSLGLFFRIIKSSLPAFPVSPTRMGEGGRGEGGEVGGRGGSVCVCVCVCVWGGGGGVIRLPQQPTFFKVCSSENECCEQVTWCFTSGYRYLKSQ